MCQYVFLYRKKCRYEFRYRKKYWYALLYKRKLTVLAPLQKKVPVIIPSKRAQLEIPLVSVLKSKNRRFVDTVFSYFGSWKKQQIIFFPPSSECCNILLTLHWHKGARTPYRCTQPQQTYTQIYASIHSSHKHVDRIRNLRNVICTVLRRTTRSSNRLAPPSTNRIEKKTVRSYVIREVFVLAEKRRQPELTPRCCCLVFKELHCCYHQRKFPRHYSSLLMGHTRRMRVLIRAGQQTIRPECQRWLLAFDTSFYKWVC